MLLRYRPVFRSCRTFMKVSKVLGDRLHDDSRMKTIQSAHRTLEHGNLRPFHINLNDIDSGQIQLTNDVINRSPP